ncbi:MAG TPA: sugar-binding protein [Terriglobia bacterium]|nr:sugar-binding protein [Terriglobia bacterium]
MKRFATIFSSCLLVLTAACAPSADNKSGGNAGGELKLAFVTNNSSSFWTIARQGVEKADAELTDVSADFRITSDGTAAEQRRIIDDLITRGVNGIAISPVDPQNQTALINEVAAKTLLFTQDSDAPDSNRACYVGTDNVAAGREAGQLIKEALPAGGKIMLFVGKRDARNAQERIQGIQEALKDSKIEILDVRTDDADEVRAKSNAADTLVRYPEIKALVGLWSYNGPAILSAVKEAKKTGQVKIVAFDEADETLAGVSEGAIHGTVVQQPFEFGYQAIKLMAQTLKGDKTVIPPNKQIVIPTLVVKKDNVEDFTKRLNEMLGR